MVVHNACALFDDEGRRVEGRHFNYDHPINQQGPLSQHSLGEGPSADQYAAYDNWHTGTFDSEDTGWSDEEGHSAAAWEGNFRGCHTPPVDLRIAEPTSSHEDMLSELEDLEARAQARHKRAGRLQESIDRTSSELDRMRTTLGNIFDTKMQLARDLVPLLRPDLHVFYSFSVDGDYELLLQPDLRADELSSARHIFAEYRHASAAMSDALRREDDFW
eukprot:gene25896-31695_t